MHAKRFWTAALVLLAAAGCSKKTVEAPPLPPPNTEILTTDPAAEEAKMVKAEEARKKAATEAFSKQVTDLVAAGRKFNKFLEGVPPTDQFAAQIEPLRVKYEAIMDDPEVAWQGGTKDLARRVVEAAEGEEQIAKTTDEAGELGKLAGDEELGKKKAEERKEHVDEQSKRITRLLDELDRCVKEQSEPKDDIN